MTDPCDQAKACKSNKLIFAGEFSYTCPDLLPAVFFGLQSYNLFLDRRPRERLYTLSVVNSNNVSILLATFQLNGQRYATFTSLQADYTVTKESDYVLVISKKNGPLWRIGSRATFSSCLFINNYNYCLSRPPQMPPKEGEGVLFTFPCANLASANKFELQNYNLQIYNNGRGYTIFLYPLRANFLNVGEFALSVVDGFANARGNNGYTVEVRDATLAVYSAQGTPQPRGTPQPVWYIRQVEQGFAVEVAVPSISGLLGAIPIEQPETRQEGCPLLFGKVLLSKDEKQICESRFTVTFFTVSGVQSTTYPSVMNFSIKGLCPPNSKVYYNNQDCPGCTTIKKNQCASWTQQRREYVFYCTNVTSVLRGKGCTLASKVTSLQKEGKNITLAGAATYGMLRLMLSLLLWGRFDVWFLRQKHYPSFLEKLKSSEFCAYYSLFRDNDYWQFFQV